jgi:hypothetical protein
MPLRAVINQDGVVTPTESDRIPAQGANAPTVCAKRRMCFWSPEWINSFALRNREKPLRS